MSGAVIAVIAAILPATATPFVCTPTEREDLLPHLIVPMAGAAPIWFIDGHEGRWAGADAPAKSVWVIHRDQAQELRAIGRRLDGAGTLTFREGMDGRRSTVLSIQDVRGASMTPGGASADVMRKFVFVASYVFYPSPGCWEIETRVGPHRRTVVVSVR